MIDNDRTIITLPDWRIKIIEEKVVELFKELNINQLPYDVFDIAVSKGYRIDGNINNYVDIPLFERQDGISCRNIKKEYSIIYDGNTMKQRIRFTIMHEIGHIVLGHRHSSQLAEKEANYFAAYALAPKPLIKKYNINNESVLSKFFDVSYSCSEVILSNINNEKGTELNSHEKWILENLK